MSDNGPARRRRRARIERLGTKKRLLAYGHDEVTDDVPRRATHRRSWRAWQTLPAAPRSSASNRRPTTPTALPPRRAAAGPRAAPPPNPGLALRSSRSNHQESRTAWRRRRRWRYRSGPLSTGCRTSGRSPPEARKAKVPSLWSSSTPGLVRRSSSSVAWSSDGSGLVETSAGRRSAHRGSGYALSVGGVVEVRREHAIGSAVASFERVGHDDCTSHRCDENAPAAFSAGFRQETEEKSGLGAISSLAEHKPTRAARRTSSPSRSPPKPVIENSTADTGSCSCRPAIRNRSVAWTGICTCSLGHEPGLRRLPTAVRRFKMPTGTGPYSASARIC